MLDLLHAKKFDIAQYVINFCVELLSLCHMNSFLYFISIRAVISWTFHGRRNYWNFFELIFMRMIQVLAKFGSHLWRDLNKVKSNPMRLFAIFVIIKLDFLYKSFFMHIKAQWHNNAFYIFWLYFLPLLYNRQLRKAQQKFHSKINSENYWNSADKFQFHFVIIFLKIYWDFKLIYLHTINYCFVNY